MKYLRLLPICILFLFARHVMAIDFEVSPYIIDETAKAKEIFEYTVKVKNNDPERRTNLYVFVNDVLSDTGRTGEISPSELDKKTSIARWTEVKRGVLKIQPGKEIEIPLKIQVGIDALPGKYHAIITFAQGGNRASAEKEKGNGKQILVSINVEDQIIEKAQLTKFAPARKVFTKYPVNINLNIKNNGNEAILPRGTVYIYNRRDQLVGEVGLTSQEIADGADGDFDLSWVQEKKSFGKFKARLEVEYGEKSTRDLQDTIYFWVFPLWLLMFFGAGFLSLIIILFYLMTRKSKHQLEYYKEDEDEDGVINLS